VKFFSSILLCSMLVVSYAAQADNISVPFKSISTPQKAVGIVISERGVFEKTGLLINGNSNEDRIATMPVSRSEKSGSTFSTVMFETDSGEIMFAPLVSVDQALKAASSKPRPICKLTMPISNDQTLISNIGALQSLYEIRKVRRDFIQLEIKNKLRGDFLEKLESLESGFGLVTDKPLSTEMPSAELTLRLFRILTAVRNYSANK